jgi:large subunit ribosomal protein L24
MNKIRKDDTVMVIAGKDKGRTGKVLSVLRKKKRPTTGLWLLIEGINVVKKHVKANPQREKPGGIVPKEAPIHASNIALYNPVAKKADRVGFKFLDDGRKVRTFKSTGEVVDV